MESDPITVDQASRNKSIKFEEAWPKATKQFITFYMDKDGIPEPKIATIEILAIGEAVIVIARAEINLCFHFGEKFSQGTVEMIQVSNVFKTQVHRINYTAKIKL